MDLNLKAALAGPARTFTAVRIELPDPGEEAPYVARLLNGGQVVIGGEVFSGLDARLGTLDRIESISDGVDAEASTASLILLPADAPAIETLAHPQAQGSPVTIRQGAVDTATGLPLGTELLFQGEINYSTLVADADGRAVRVELVTEEARALEPNDERRLSNAFHQSIWPGELGLAHVTGVAQPDYWRTRKPAVSYGGGYGDGASLNPGGGGTFTPW